MRSNVNLNSAPASTPPTSAKSKNPSNEQFPLQIEERDTDGDGSALATSAPTPITDPSRSPDQQAEASNVSEEVTEVSSPRVEEPSPVAEVLSPRFEEPSTLFFPVSLALFSAWIIHRLTRSREREKLVFDLYRQFSEQLAGCGQVATKAWAAKQRSQDRATGVVATLWRVQQIGASAERFRRLSKRRKWLAFPPFKDVTIDLGKAIIEFRRELTDDPFQDPSRAGDSKRAGRIESAVGSLQQALDTKFYDWLA